MPITGMNVSTVTTPSSRPSTSSERSQPPLTDGPNRPSSRSSPSVHHPRKVTSIQSCMGLASVVVAWNTTNSTARKTRTPITGCSSTRSMRSDKVTWSTACMSRPRNMPAVQSSRASARDSAQTLRPSAVFMSASAVAVGSAVSPCGTGVPSKLAAIASAKALPPSSVRPSIATTGMPSSKWDSRSASTPQPLRTARSFMVSATTVGSPSSTTIDSRYSDRDSAVASSTTTARSGTGMPDMPISASTATCSSGLIGAREYVPGVSTNCQFCAFPAVFGFS